MKWTNREEAIVRRIVRENPDNLKRAFNLCSEKINRTPGSIKVRWYNKISQTNPCFITVSPKKRYKK